MQPGYLKHTCLYKDVIGSDKNIVTIVVVVIENFRHSSES